MFYSFDTSALINSWYKHYRIKNFPGVWERLHVLIEEETVRAVDEVRLEIYAQDDDLASWIKQRSGIFIPLLDSVQECASSIIADYPGLIKINSQRAQADPFVIALAQVYNCKVVTYEKLDDNPGAKKDSIPKACRELKIGCITMAELIEEQGWTFN